MKNKIVQSNIYFGNLPIYNYGADPGATRPEGCEFVINTRIKYELGLCSFQFINQNVPHIYTLDGTFNDTVELDISALHRLQALMLMSSHNNPTLDTSSYVHLEHTRLKSQESIKYGTFVKVSPESIEFTIDNKHQHIYLINGAYQVLAFKLLLQSVIDSTINGYMQYNITKNSTNSATNIGVISPSAPAILPQNMPKPISNAMISTPKPVGEQPTVTSTPPPPPPSVTNTIVPKAPGIPPLPNPNL